MNRRAKKRANSRKRKSNHDIFTKKKRSEIMSSIKSKNTGIERVVFEHLKKQGVNFKKHYIGVIGKPDIAIPSKKIAVFIDSDFWHGWNYSKWSSRLTSKFWTDKIADNIRRDKFVNRELKKLGWTIMRIWSHDLRKNSIEKTFSKVTSLCKS